MHTVRLPFYARLALTLLAVVLSFSILRVAADIFIPLVFGLLISILLFPVARFFENKLRFGRGGAAITSVLLFLSVLVGFIYFLAYEVIQFSDDFPLLRKRFQVIFDGLQHWLWYKFHITNRQQSEYINKSVNKILESAGQSLSNAVVSVSGFLILTIFVLIFTFFMLYHRKLLMRFVLHLFSIGHRSKVHEVIFETKGMINAYVRGLLLEMVMVSIVNCAMLMIMGIQYALLLGVMTAILNIIPYLGFYTSIAIVMVVTLANSTGNLAMEAGIGLFIIHMLDANILMPRIVGARVKMNPFITIVAVIVGQFIWGIPGMFLFIPMVGIMKLVCDRVEGMEAWGMLIGVDEGEKKPPLKKISLGKNAADEH